MKAICQRLLTFALLFFTTGVLAQDYNVSGVVVNDKGDPLKGATVFIGGSERVMPTDENGRFSFGHIPPGSFQLSVQMIGFAPEIRNIIVKNAAIMVAIKLQSKPVSLAVVNIGKKGAWARNFEIFKRVFLGQSANARQCIIVNPQVVDFSTRKGLLEAEADDFLIIENKRLGYRVRYLLQDFSYNYDEGVVLYHGDCSFEELDGTTEQKSLWAQNRLKTYQGSFMHFLRSVSANNTLENGFIVRPLYGYGRLRVDSSVVDPYKVVIKNRQVKFDSLITAIDSNFISFRFKKLYIIYDPKKAATFGANVSDNIRTKVIDNDASLLRLAANEAIIDKKGSTDYRDFFIQGYWTNARVGDQLPVEYKPPVPDIPHRNVPVNPVLMSLQKWVDSIPQEKTYLHMDKPYYASGDTIWFKGYLTSGSRHQLSHISGSAYIDLINEENQAVKTLELPVDSGTLAGNLILGDDIKAGSYRIRAYTQWMRNAGEDYFFEKTFTIGDPKTFKENADSKPSLQQTDIQFFPESGSLVNGITSKVGFKAVGPDGLGTPISGTVTDNTNKPVAQISTLHAGMGNFLLKPLTGKTYTANIKFTDGATKSVPLPTVSNSGYVLSVYQPTKDSILVRIQASAIYQQSTINLVVHSSGEIVFSSPIEISEPMTSVWLDKGSFPSGIAQFTIFSKDYAPLNERIAFIKNTDHMALTIKTEKPVYKGREHVQLQLNAKEGDGVPVAANFSVAVTDENKTPVDESSERTIFSNILLSADLKGYIEKPNYYFSADTDEVNNALDNLMLTQGYRRFEWRLLDSIVNAKPIFKPEGLGRTFEGTVTDLQHKPLPNAAVMLVSINARISKATTTDAYGRFKFSNVIFPDSAKFAVQARGAQNSDKAIINVDSLPSVLINHRPGLADITIIKADLQKAEQDGVIPQLKGQHVLKQVEIKAAKNTPTKGVVPQGMYSLPDEESADKVITIPDPENYLTLEMFLQARLAGIRIGQDGHQFKVLVDTRSLTTTVPTDEDLNKMPPTAETPEIGLIVNGQHIISHSAIDEILEGSISPKDVAKIEVVKNNQALRNFLRVGGRPAPAGYLLILTKPATMRKQYLPNVANISPKGFNSVRQFYSPRYDKPTDITKPDTRTTIYWNPYVNTDATTGNATLYFYNADGPGNYRVVIEGINAAGELGRQVYHYKVE